MITKFKIFETTIFDKYTKLEQKYKKVDSEIRHLIDDYMNINQNKWEDWDISTYYKCVDFEIDKYYIYINFYQFDYNEENWDITLENDDFKDFMRFIKDPDMYRNITKYNL